MAKKEFFSFKSADGKTTVHAVKWLPDSEHYTAILQITHGMLEYIERYDDFASYIANKGFLVVGHDHVGHGQSISAQQDLGYFGENPSDILVSDMHALRCMVQEEKKPYFMLGHSMGSYLLRKYLSIHGDKISGAILMGTGYVSPIALRFGIAVAHLEALAYGWKHRSKLLQSMTYSKPYKQYSLDGSDKTNSWLTKDVSVVEKYYKDPKCTFLFTDNAYLGLFEAILFSEKSANIKKIPKDLPILLISGQDDPVGNMGVGVFHVFQAYNKLGITDIDIQIFEDDRHEILNETDKEDVYRCILQWLRMN